MPRDRPAGATAPGATAAGATAAGAPTAAGSPTAGAGARRAGLALAAASAIAWAVTLLARGRFWLPGPWLPPAGASGETWPAVTVIVPARDEAELLPLTLASLLDQRYGGRLRVVLVDDQSSDGTAEVALRVADAARGQRNGGTLLDVVAGTPTPPGWAGKVWAMQQGVQAASASGHHGDWLLFSDADIVHDDDVVARLVATARSRRRDLVSVMAELSVATRWERLLVPAFVYFFALLYPFRRVSGGKPRAAAAAGGCLLVRREALERSGGLEAMAPAVIDDLALAAQVAASGGRLWLGFDRGVRSIRRYPRLADLWQMVARSAYAELDHSPLRLAGALAGLALLFAVPPAAVLAGASRRSPAAAGAPAAPAAWLGAAALAAQTISYLPTVRMYRLPLRWAATLPVAGWLYGAMTVSSVLAHHRGEGIAWKERAADPSGRAAVAARPETRASAREDGRRGG